MKFIDTYLKPNLRPLLLMLLLPMMSLTYMLINRFSGPAHDITIGLDAYIPYVKYFAVPYIIWYLYIPGAFVLLCIHDKRIYFKTMFVYATGCIIASLIFLLYQTTVPRSAMLTDGHDFFSWVMRLIHENDKPVNCLPSIHVFTCWLILRAVAESSLGTLRNNLLNAVLSVSIILSTLFTKQHAILDVVTGMLLAELLLILAHRYEAKLVYLMSHKPFCYFSTTDRRTYET